MFPESILVVLKVPLLRDTLALFEEYWTAVDGANVQVHAHNVVNLLGSTALEWLTDILFAKALPTTRQNSRVIWQR